MPAFCAYSDICLWIKNGIDGVFRLHQGRVMKGKKKPKYTVIEEKNNQKKKKKKSSKYSHDSLILWTKPQDKPKDISQDDFDCLPQDLVVRQIHYYICIPGFRSEEITIITTLLDAVEYPAFEIIKLYDSIWSAEVNLRHIKTNARHGYINL